MLPLGANSKMSFKPPSIFNVAVFIALAAYWNWIQSGVMFCIKLLEMLAKVKFHGLLRHKKYFSWADLFEGYVDAEPDRVQFITVEDEKAVTLRDLDDQANQLAHWATSKGYKAGDTVGLMMLNRPSVVSVFVGMAKMGIATALLNTNTSGKTFVHVVEVATKQSATKIVIVDNELRDQIAGEIPQLEALGIQCVFWESDVLATIDNPKNASKYPTTRPSAAQRKEHVRENDPLIYIFTSGTTGLPKSSKISHSRFYVAAMPFAHLCSLTSKDRVYNTLPLYHSAGLMAGAAACISSGAVIVLRRKFSVRNFTTDCLRFKCNVVQYIGELCRYLLNAPVNEELESQLRIDYAFGNGMVADIWSKFQKRYNVQHIVEFYGATEGNCNLFNGCDVVGSCGFVPRFLDFLYPLSVVKPDPDNNDMPYRDPKTGLCKECKSGEVGLLIGVIKANDTSRRFEGYTDSKATSKKVLNDVFRKGDQWFNSGDLLRRDFWGYYYWSDRTGDTFRWKGENVATTEVETVIGNTGVGATASEAAPDSTRTDSNSDGKSPLVADVAVYGVRVPNCDGRAGMAAVVLREAEMNTAIAAGGAVSEDVLTAMAEEMKKNLPAYSRPLFVRFDRVLNTTGTFKHQKTGLVADGFDPALVLAAPGKGAAAEGTTTTPAAIALYLYQARDNRFVPLTADTFKKIDAGTMQL